MKKIIHAAVFKTATDDIDIHFFCVVSNDTMVLLYRKAKTVCLNQNCKRFFCCSSVDWITWQT